MRKFLSVLTAFCVGLSLFASCTKADDTVSTTSNSQENASAISENETFSFESLSINGGVPDLGRAYQIDIEYMQEMSENQDAYPGVQLEISYRYTGKWKELMNYYYAYYYNELEKAEQNNPFAEIGRNPDFAAAKAALEASQIAWEQSLDADREWMIQPYAIEFAMIDKYSSYYYNAYRTRAITLYFMCEQYASYIEHDEDFIFLE